MNGKELINIVLAWGIDQTSAAKVLGVQKSRMSEAKNNPTKDVPKYIAFIAENLDAVALVKRKKQPKKD